MAYEVSCDFPGGNVCDVVIDDSQSPAVIEFSADPHGGPEALWFCFRVTHSGKSGGDKLTLRLRHYLSLAYTHADMTGSIRPVLRRLDSDWHRLGVGERLDYDDGRIDLQWTVDGPATRSWLEVAFCYPHGPADVQRLVSECGGYWRADTIGVSAGGRPMLRLSNQSGQIGSDRPGVYLLSHQHAGETSGGWALHGLLRGLAESGEKSAVVWAVPIADVDGVVQGDYGKDGYPYDLNRAWGHPPMRHETLVLQHDMRLWAQRCKPTLALDSHSPGACEATGIYCYQHDPVTAPRRHDLVKPWAEAFQQALQPQYAAEDFARVANYKSRWDSPTFTDFAGVELDCAAIAFETSYALAGDLVLTREHYEDIGKRLAGVIAERLG